MVTCPTKVGDVRGEATPTKYRTHASKPDAQAKRDFAYASGFDGVNHLPGVA